MADMQQHDRGVGHSSEIFLETIPPTLGHHDNPNPHPEPHVESAKGYSTNSRIPTTLLNYVGLRSSALMSSATRVESDRFFPSFFQLKAPRLRPSGHIQVLESGCRCADESLDMAYWYRSKCYRACITRLFMYVVTSFSRTSVPIPFPEIARV